MQLSPFHLAIPVYDLAAARHFYGSVFGLEEGRSSDHWVDFNFFGHQLVIHLAPKNASQEAAHTNACQPESSRLPGNIESPTFEMRTPVGAGLPAKRPAQTTSHYRPITRSVSANNCSTEP
ncbi:hypothetical protein D3C72_1979550 [compost metagenome]